MRKITSSVDNYTKFAARFGLPPGVLAGIRTDPNLDFIGKTQAVFLWWHANIANPTYLSFVETCLELTEGGVAREMCKLCTTIIPTRKCIIGQMIGKHNLYIVLFFVYDIYLVL